MTHPLIELFRKVHKLLYTLYHIESNSYYIKYSTASTLRQRYEVCLALCYAANSKELRDTDNREVHSLLNEITNAIIEINSWMRIRLYPENNKQLTCWEKSLAGDPEAKYAMRDDISLEISVMDAEPKGRILNVKRVWSHVGNSSGMNVNFEIELNDEQMAMFEKKHAYLTDAESV